MLFSFEVRSWVSIRFESSGVWKLKGMHLTGHFPWHLIRFVPCNLRKCLWQDLIASFSRWFLFFPYKCSFQMWNLFCLVFESPGVFFSLMKDMGTPRNWGYAWFCSPGMEGLSRWRIFQPRFIWSSYWECYLAYVAESTGYFHPHSFSTLSSQVWGDETSYFPTVNSAGWHWMDLVLLLWTLLVLAL